MRVSTEKLTFGAGEIAPSFQRRADTRQHADGAATMSNVRLLDSGGFARRHGTRHLATISANSVLVPFVFSTDQEYVLALSPGGMSAYSISGAAMGTLSGCPWTISHVQTMAWAQAGDTLFVTHSSFMPQVVQRTGASSWTRAAWSSDAGPGGVQYQPYYKFADPASTLTPSGSTGNVTLSCSHDAFQAGHVGTLMRYGGSEMLITGVTSARLASATIQQTLPPTSRLGFESAGGSFGVGEVVEGRTTGAKGEIRAIEGGPTSGVLIVVLDASTGFFEAWETVQGPNGNATINGIETGSPAAHRDWDEAYLSPVYGYPGTVGIHRDRLWWGGHPQLPSYVLASRIGGYYNFDLADAEDDAGIFEGIGDSAVPWVRHFASAEMLLVLTDQGPYYVPESVASPLRPTSFQCARIGSLGIGGVRPIAFDDGFLAAHRAGNAMVDLRPTGDVTSAWKSTNPALLAPHLLRTPVSMAATHGVDGAPERYAYVVNADGTMAVLHSIQAQEVQGWTLWSTAGAFKSVAVVGGRTFVACTRTFSSGVAWTLEEMDADLTMDGTVTLSSVTTPVALYAGQTVSVRSGRSYLGDYTVDADGLLPLTEEDWSGPVEVGRNFTPRVETFTPDVKLPSGSSAAKVKRIAAVSAFVHEGTRVRIAGREMHAHDIGEDLTVAPPSRTRWEKVTLLGRSKNPTITITQDDPVPFTVLALVMEVEI